MSGIEFLLPLLLASPAQTGPWQVRTDATLRTHLQAACKASQLDSTFTGPRASAALSAWLTAVLERSPRETP